MSRLLLGIAATGILLINIANVFSWWPVNAAGTEPIPLMTSAAPQAETHFVRQVPIITNDVVFDPVTGKLYASVPSRAGAMGNSIARINPTSGEIEGFVFVGSEPGKLALADDGQTLYVSLDGAAAVRSFNITTQTPGIQFALGESVSSGPFFVRDLAVAPGIPDLVAVSRRNRTSQPDFEGVAVYDAGVRRPLTTPGHTGSEFIAFSNSASTLHGTGSGAGLQKMSVTSSGVSVVSTSPTSGGGDFKVEDGLVYMPTGQVHNAETGTLTGTFALPVGGGTRQVEPDSSVGRVYFLTGDFAFFDTDTRTLTLNAFDQNTFLPLGTLQIPNVMGQVTSLTRWGANGLAFGTTGGRFYLIQTTLVPSSEPVPSPTPTPSPTSTPSPTPIPTPAPGQLREVSITAKDIVINPVTETIYASVPSSVGAGGNSITPFSPVSALVGQPVFVGSEPNKMAISDNGQVIYVGLDGAKAVRRFDVTSSTPGLQFPVGSNQQGQFSAVDIEVAPGQPQTIAVVRGTNPNNADGGVAVFDDGVQRSIATTISDTINTIEYSASPLVFYGNNNSNSEFGFRKLASVSCGVMVLSAKRSLLQGLDFRIENGLAYSTSGRVIDPETGTLVGTYPVFEGLQSGVVSSAVLPDATSNRVYFFVRDIDPFAPIPKTLFVRAYDLRTFLHVGTLAVPEISGSPTTVVRWGTDGFAFRTAGDKVYLLQTSLIASQTEPVLPAPSPSPPTFTLRGQVSSFNSPPVPTVTLQLSGGQNGTTTTNADGSFAFPGLSFCAEFTVTPIPLETFTFSPPSQTIPAGSQGGAFFTAIPKLVRFAQTSINIGEGGGSVNVSVIRSGDLSQAASVMYETGNGTASDRSDYIAAIGTLRFAPNEGSKLITVFVTDDVRDETNETLTLTLSSPTGALLGTASTVTVTITDNDAADGTANPADDPTFFVRQHYRDFLNRDPDAAGLAFWVNEITSCGSDTQCVEIKRINVSAAFFLSIESQETGFLVYRMFKAAYGDATSPNVPGTVPIIRLNEFIADARRMGEGFRVGIGDWELQLELNKRAYALEFVQRARFIAAYPTSMTAEEFVTKLEQNVGGALSPSEKASLIALLGATPADVEKRAQVVRAVADDADLRQAEFNRAFVLMQYYGYLRRNPDDPPDTNFGGWKFWLDKLNQFNGNFIQAEMVKAFISSIEYRQRFGP